MNVLEPGSASIGIWTDDGRDDSAADVGLNRDSQGVLDIGLEAPSKAISYVAIRWSAELPFGARILGDHWERGYGDLEWRGAVPERPLPWYALVHDPVSGETTGIGVLTAPSAFASWRIDASGVTLVLDVRCGGVGVKLGGRRLIAARVRQMSSSPGDSAFDVARRFCSALCSKPRLPGQPVYGGNDWYFRYGNISAESVHTDSALIRELSQSRTNAPSYVIDAGWFPSLSCNGGPYERGNAGFPDMPGLAGRMAGIGVRPGIWIRPLLTTENVPERRRISAQHPLAGSRGNTLDPSTHEVLTQVSADIRRLRSWGYTVIKHDFSTYDITGKWGFAMGADVTFPGWQFADPTRTTAEIIRGLYEVIRAAAGDAVLIGCNTVGHLGAGLFELQRTGDDTSGTSWERTRKMGVNTLAFRMPQHGAFFHCDADCVGLTSHIPWSENRLWLDVLSHSGTPLFVSADPNCIGSEQRAALVESFDRAADGSSHAAPLDWMETTCPRKWSTAGSLKVYNWPTFPASSFACPG